MGITDADPTDYRKLVMAVLEVISTDSLTIIGGQHIPGSRVLSLSIVLTADPNTGATTPSGADSITYVNGEHGPWTDAANVYVFSIWNLINAVNDAVSLDLGNNRYPNLYTNFSVLSNAINPNLPPEGITSGNWSNTTDSQSFYYGRIPSPYQTWAQALLAGQPVTLGGATGLPSGSAMETTYLCPMYRVKPTGPLLSSVFVGSATMILSVWGAWMFFTAFLAKKIMAPRVQCHCDECQRREAEEAREAANNQGGFFGRFMGRRAKPTPPTPDRDAE
ncbi:hypothetical protein FRC08_014762 [Ceratobasidium sp. 394]|nr:hypothetical protein FRC08_014762 [Ceratobasidium sp. 394]